MAAPQVNGELPNAVHGSAFLQHILDYPIVASGIHAVQTNEYAQRPIQLGDSAYRRFAAPVLPYLTKPYQYVSPYISKADSLGDRGLQELDRRFPIVKKPTEELIAETKTLIFMPYQMGLEGKDHVFRVYSSEMEKNSTATTPSEGQQNGTSGGNSQGQEKQIQAGMMAHGMAAVTTVLVVGSETLQWVGAFLSTKRKQAAEVTKEKMSQ